MCQGATASAACVAHPQLVVPGGEPGSVTVTVPVTSASRKVTLHTTSPVRAFVDLHGWTVDSSVGSAANDSLYVPVDPSRVANDLPVSGRSSQVLTLAGAPAGATAVALRVTSRASTESSYVAVCPAGQATQRLRLDVGAQRPARTGPPGLRRRPARRAATRSSCSTSRAATA